MRFCCLVSDTFFGVVSSVPFGLSTAFPFFDAGVVSPEGDASVEELGVAEELPAVASDPLFTVA